jgi:hypothetical protein
VAQTPTLRSRLSAAYRAIAAPVVEKDEGGGVWGGYGAVGGG